jgi:hypothetical protein
MGKLIAILSAAISVCFVSAPSFAMPIRAQIVVDTAWSVENARLVCDEFVISSALFCPWSLCQKSPAIPPWYRNVLWTLDISRRRS